MVSSTGATAMPPFSARQSTSMSYFACCSDLQDAAVGQQRAQRRHGIVEGDLRRCGVGRRQHVALGAAGRDMPQRDVAGAAGRGGETHADQVRPQRVQAVGLGVEGDHAGLGGLGDPALQRLDRRDAVVGGRRARCRDRPPAGPRPPPAPPWRCCAPASPHRPPHRPAPCGRRHCGTPAPAGTWSARPARAGGPPAPRSPGSAARSRPA